MLCHLQSSHSVEYFYQGYIWCFEVTSYFPAVLQSNHHVPVAVRLLLHELWFSGGKQNCENLFHTALVSVGCGAT